MTAEHISLLHAGAVFYEIGASPIIRSFLLLADIAARHWRADRLLHMEAVPRPIPLSNGLSSPPNPDRDSGKYPGRSSGCSITTTQRQNRLVARGLG